MKLDPQKVSFIIKNALAEDIGTGDITAMNLISPTLRTSARIIAKEQCIVAGLPVARQAFKYLDKRCVWRAKYKDGSLVKKGKTIATISGLARAVLSGERTALNFLSRMSAVATLTKKYVKRISKYKAEIYDTRKTIPGLRILDKYAVVCGGGMNHRMGLYDMALVKDNYLSIYENGRIPKNQLVSALKTKLPYGMKIEIEAENIRDVELGIMNNANIIMLDNMDIKTIKKAVKLIRKSKKPIEIEISGGVNLKKLERVARTGADRISIGAITHSPQSIDFSLEINK
ncbi:MAG: nicotinate-nucleotide diphosphorylase (carboxylating) [Elusimicrobia bacterium RIFOXYA2_FULL_39_19]|nr:MAG: nicotinate-nucleotide diphosphorylase (carboxylating) [Elusimicrobia bacterium RIFOXYA2_FULL_39_19]